MSGDFIVGFPGETDQDHRDTMDIVQQVGFASAYSFKYSPRPGTPGADLTDHVDPKVASERLAELQDALKVQQADFHRSCIGSEMDVLFEKKGRFEGQITGRSPYLQAAHITAPESLIGTVQRVHVDSMATNSLDCSLVSN
ncbi:TRAM domain-containing protein [bacterium]|nr:TRAM domain-containing protein [bacterium]